MEERVKLSFGDHRVTLYRRSDVKTSSWFFSMHLAEEDRKYRKSLNTADLDKAKKEAYNEVIRILARVESGQKILAVSLADLRRRFTLHREALVAQGQIAKDTLDNHNTRINHGMDFLASVGKHIKTRVSGLDGEIWNGYLDWRFAYARTKGKTIRRDVVRDELLTIRKMFLFAQEQKLCTEKAIPKWTFSVEKEGPKRQRMTQRDYLTFLGAIKDLVDEATDERQRYNRILLRHFALVIAHSGMRSGELFGLKNKFVDVRRSTNECLVTIKAETSKVRVTRQITFHGSYGGNIRREPVNYLIRWMDEYQKHKGPEDYVFAPLDTGQSECRDVYYHQYKVLRVKLKERGIGWFDTYHCRHFWITNRLLAGEPIHLVAKAAGTSVAEIESTYSHVLSEMATKQFNKRQVQYDSDGGFSIVDTPAKKVVKRTRKTALKGAPAARR